uniref:PilT protein n=1 Tax=Pseudomonas aeruginosa TaxID=287 RepID=Q8VVL6_PSEAI|nr:ORF 7; putative [Pseudomonas aeruginosa PAO1]
MSRVCMPSEPPVWIAEYICATLSSRIRLRIAGVPIMISWAATRPPPIFLIRVCEITDCSDSESIERTMAFSSAGNTSTTRSMVFAAEVVCRVPNTRWPVSAAVRARRMVSRSRISPTRMMSGSSRSAERSASLKPRVSRCTSRWLTRHFFDSWTNSIGSSMVRMWWYLVLFR